jgi:hypothetical protein
VCVKNTVSAQERGLVDRDPRRLRAKRCGAWKKLRAECGPHMSTKVFTSDTEPLDEDQTAERIFAIVDAMSNAGPVRVSYRVICTSWSGTM